MSSSTRIRQGAAGILLFVIGILMSLVLHRPAPEHLREISMERLLRTSLLPVGQTMYIWGGGWNQEDAGAGREAVTLGVSKRWAEYAARQTETYDFDKTRYQSHDGLDCSGYIGWLLYNVFHTRNGETGYVTGASKMARACAARGWGYLVQGDYKPGDICSMEGHVWMSLGRCMDGSVLLVHASPPGVRICGTYLDDGAKSEAVKLAEQVMQKQYPAWYARYPECGVGYFYLEDSVSMRWYTDEETDPYHLQEMWAEDVVHFLYPDM